MSVAAIGPKLWSYLPLLLLVVSILVGVPMAYRLWRETHGEDEPIRGADLLSDFEQAYAAGKMDEAEFRRIRDLVIGGKGEFGGKPRKTPRRDTPGPVPTTSEDQPSPAQPDVPLPPSDQS
jgi:hypothetical protein